jgi:hypothetical protein
MKMKIFLMEHKKWVKKYAESSFAMLWLAYSPRVDDSIPNGYCEVDENNIYSKEVK